jgi:DHA1 family bicyclomycin/chloramphenicol resistance-like MFS transporter
VLFVLSVVPFRQRGRPRFRSGPLSRYSAAMPPAARPMLTEKAPWALVLLLGSLTALGPLAIDMYLPSLPAISRGLHASPGAVSVTLAAFFAGLGIGQLVYGPLSDRIGRRGPVIFGVAIFVAGAVLCALAPNVWFLTAARFLQAVGGSAGQVVARAAVRDRFGHQMAARVLSLLMLVLGLAPIIAPVFGGYLLLVGSWRAIFWVQAAVSAVILIAVILAFRESRTHEMRAAASGESPIATFRYLLSHPRVIGFTLAGAFNSGAFFGWISMSSYLLIEVYGVTPANFGWWFGANAAGFIGMSQVNAHLLRWRTPEEVLVRARLASIVFAAIVVFDAFTGLGGMLGVIVPLYVTLASFGLVGPNTQAASMNVDPTRAGAISSITGSATFAMGTLVSAVGGYLHDGTARPLALLILVMILASSAALYGLAKPVATHAAV